MSNKHGNSSEDGTKKKKKVSKTKLFTKLSCWGISAIQFRVKKITSV